MDEIDKLIVGLEVAIIAFRGGYPAEDNANHLIAAHAALRAAIAKKDAEIARLNYELSAAYTVARLLVNPNRGADGHLDDD